MLFRKLKLDWRYGFFELLIVVAGVMIALGADGLIYTGDLVRIPWASDFAVTESEAREILARLRDIPEVRSRIEGMVRVQASQFVVLSDLRILAGQTLEMVEAARR